MIKAIEGLQRDRTAWTRVVTWALLGGLSTSPLDAMYSLLTTVTVALASFWGITVSSADTPTAVKEPRCVTVNRSGAKLCLESDGHTIDLVSISGQIVSRSDDLPGPYFGPQCVTDVPTEIKVCVERDGHHLRATAPTGKLLWRRDPFVDAKLPLYRTPQPPTINVIRAGNFIQPPRGQPGRTVWIMFESSQFGEVDLKSGDFLVEGEN